MALLLIYTKPWILPINIYLFIDIVFYGYPSPSATICGYNVIINSFGDQAQ